MLGQANPDFQPLFNILCKMAGLYLLGVFCGWLNSFTMAFVTQGTLRNLRVRIFSHMESLPIRYFDTHPHGDTMSIYTNDVDTLRQLVGQSVPQLISSIVTVITVFVNMVRMNLPLTCLSMVMVAVQDMRDMLLVEYKKNWVTHTEIPL